jgi:hypothetical protein
VKYVDKTNANAKLVGDDIFGCNKDFALCFPALSAASSETRRDWPLAELEKYVGDELSHAGNNELELFGMKFPHDSRAKYCIGALLLVLLYFWLHMRERSVKVSDCDEGLEVAWIGLYSSRIARLTTWLSVFVLSVYGVFVASASILEIHDPRWRTVWPVLKSWRGVEWGVVPITATSLLSLACIREMAKLATLSRGTPKKVSER